METGVPYMLYKDACNKKSNQKNLGTIKSSNLCTEIIEYSNENETAVCNLASIALAMYVKKELPQGQWEVYGKSNCGCKTKKLLNECGSSFKFTCLDAYIPQVEFFEKHNIEDRKFPQIFHNGKRIGGYSNLKKLTEISYDYNKLHEVTKIVTENLTKLLMLISILPSKPELVICFTDLLVLEF